MAKQKLIEEVTSKHELLNDVILAYYVLTAIQQERQRYISKPIIALMSQFEKQTLKFIAKTAAEYIK